MKILNLKFNKERCKLVFVNVLTGFLMSIYYEYMFMLKNRIHNSFFSTMFFICVILIYGYYMLLIESAYEMNKLIVVISFITFNCIIAFS